MYHGSICVVLLCLACLSAGQTPTPPKMWPLMWHSWVVTTVKEPKGDAPVYNEGRLLWFDSQNKVACRYWEQNLVNVSLTRRADYCDYTALLHYTMADTKPDSNCTSVSAVSDTIDRIVFPDDFVNSARFLGVNNVSQYQCNHFYAQAVKLSDGSYIQMDVWVDTNRGLPCQISTLDLKTQVITTWAFDGFDTVIPHQAIQQCSIPKIMCSQEDWLCSAKPNANPGDLGGALGWVCSQGGVDCSPINPGGAYFYPDTLIAHCDWAFNAYYRANRYNQGIDACFFNDLAQLVPPTPPSPPAPVRRETSARSVDAVSFLRGMTGVGASVFPYDIACSN